MRLPGAMRLRDMFDIVRITPGLLGVLRDLRHGGSPQQVLAARRSRAFHQLPPDRIIPEVNRAARLLGPMIGRHRAGPCVIRSLTAFRGVQGPDKDVEWVLGFCGTDAASDSSSRDVDSSADNAKACYTPPVIQPLGPWRIVTQIQSGGGFGGGG